MRTLLVLALAGCAGGDPAGDPLTWYGDVKPVVDEHCSSCHTDGGVSPFALDSYADYQTFATEALASMENGTMPPFQADPGCRDYAHDRSLPPEALDVIRDWTHNGMSEGDPADEVPFTAPTVAFNPTHTAGIDGSYLSTAVSADDYRCFILEDLTFDEPAYVVASDVAPGSPQVHHVLVYAVDSSYAFDLNTLDNADSEPGYRCFGGPIPISGTAGYEEGLPTQIAAWVPGLFPTRMPDDSAIRIDAGSAIVMQVHYSAVAGSPEPDETEVQLEISEDEPSFLVSTRPLPIYDLVIPADEADVTFTRSFKNYRDDALDIFNLAGHMHLLGQSHFAEIARASGDKECLLDIPVWDFDWQQSYEIDADAPARVEPGDSIDVTCVYDNTANNQPVIDGAPVTPSEVYWGDGTLDEMCILYFSNVEPFRPATPDGVYACWGTEDCLADCGDTPTIECMLSCSDTPFGCNVCMLEGLEDCAFEYCQDEAQAAEDCLYACAENVLLLGGSFGNCMDDQCGTQWRNMMDCSQDSIGQGRCDLSMAGCGLSL